MHNLRSIRIASVILLIVMSFGFQAHNADAAVTFSNIITPSSGNIFQPVGSRVWYYLNTSVGDEIPAYDYSTPGEPTDEDCNSAAAAAGLSTTQNYWCLYRRWTNYVGAGGCYRDPSASNTTFCSPGGRMSSANASPIGSGYDVAIYTSAPSQSTYQGNYCSGQIPGGDPNQSVGSPSWTSNSCTVYQYTYTPPVNNPPVGNLDQGTCTIASGWAYDPDTKSQSINVNLYVDGTYIGQTVANQSRPDVQAAFGLPMSNYGFSSAIPSSYTDGNNHTVSAIALDSAGGTNTTIGSATFNCVPPQANLTSSGLANYTVSLGQPLTVSGTISNTGNAATTGGFTNLFVTNLDGSGTYWHTLQNAASNALGASASVGTSTTFPAGTFTAVGTYAYDLCANYNSSWQTTVSESNYGDNCAPAGYITVVAPDLTASSGNAITTYVGQPVSLSATITNSGNGSTNAGFHNEWQVTLSDQATVVENGNSDVGTLGPGASAGVSHTTSYTFPNPGTYYYRVCADNNFGVGGGWTGSITESNENNNCGPWAAVNVIVPAAANLTSSGLSNYTVSLGQPLTVSGTVSNTGNAATTGGFTDLFVTNLDGSGTYWHTLQNASSGVVGAGASAVTSTTFPAGTFASVGTYAYDLCANYNSSWQTTVAESNYGDNCAPAGYITVVAPDITAASGAAVSGFTNQTLTFTGTVTNSGNGAASWFPNSVHICDGNCATVNRYVAASALGSLGVGASQSVSGASSFSAAGTYYYQMCGDTDTNGYQDITESNYSNNCGAWTTITITAPSGGISASPNPCTITSGTSCSTTVSWSSNASAVQVWVQQNGGGETDFANTGGTGSSPAPWIGQPGNYYDFNMYDYSSGSRGAKLGTVRVTALEANLTASQGATASSIVGQPVTLSSYVANTGNGTAGYFPNILQVCDGNCATINTTQAATAVGALSAGSTQYISSTYTPTVNTQLYYRFCANYNTSWQNVAAESNYGDNCGNWAALNMGPAIPGTISNPTTTCSVDGTHVSISWTPASGATTYYPRFYAPTAAQCTSFGWQVWTVDNQTCYPNPDTWSQTSVNNFPVTPGQAYAWYVATGNSSGANWNGVTTQNFTCAGAADLTAATPANTSGTAGTNLSFAGTVTNNGTGATTGGFWNLLQICNDTNCSSYNSYSSEGWVNTLGAGASSGVSTNATLPGTAGNYVYRWCANNNTSWQNVVTETNYGNNCGGWGTLTVASAVPPTVSCTPSSSSVKTGDSVTFTANPSSTATGPYAWTDSDGATGSGNTFTRTYTTPGTYSMQVKGSNTPAGYCSPSQITVAANYCTTGTPALSISASPVRVQSGSASTITWSATNVQGQGASCTISGPGLTQTQGAGAAPSCSIAGGSQAVSITSQSTYCIVCGSSKQCTTVNVVPKFSEF